MSEQAKTVDDLITGWVKEASLGEGLLEAPVFWALVEKHAPHLHLIPGSDAVVTEKGLEAGCAAQLGCEGAPPSHWEDMPESEKEAWRFKLKLGLEGCGITVCDEVVEVSNDDGYPCPRSILFWVPGDEEYSSTDLHVGDTLYIVRKED